MRRLSLVALAVLLLDLATKAIVARRIAFRSSTVRVLGDFLRLVHVKNTGSAFSLFEGGRFFFVGFSLFAILLIVAIARSPRGRTPPYGFSLGLILGGALGNLVDRIAYGAVTDWIDAGIGVHRWPTFNVADIGISVGVCLLAIFMLRRPREDQAVPGSAEQS